MANTSTQSYEDWLISQLQVTEGERWMLIAYCIVILAISLPGNILVLLATVKYRAIKLDKMTLVMITNIAIADLGGAVTRAIPKLTSMIAHEWIYGSFLCKIAARAATFFTGASMLLIVGLNITKLTCLLSPLHARTRSSKKGYVLAALLWSVQLFIVVLMQEFVSLVETGATISAGYSSISHGCGLSIAGGSTVETVANVALIGVSMLTTVIIVGTTAWLLMFLNRVRGLQKQAVLTLVMVSGVFVVCYLPTAVYRIVALFVDLTSMAMEVTSIDTFNTYINTLKTLTICNRYGFFMHYINFAANPLIYFVSVKSFNMFVKRTINRMTGQKNFVEPVTRTSSVQSTRTVL